MWRRFMPRHARSGTRREKAPDDLSRAEMLSSVAGPSLDLRLSDQMTGVLRGYHAALGGALPYVTHELREAMVLVDRIGRGCVIEATP